jgi:hypothetical protein
MTSPSEFRPGPPPALNSTAYTTALAQVQSLGAANSTTRTLDQAKAAEFWDADNGVPLTWNNIALQVAATRSDSLLHAMETGMSRLWGGIHWPFDIEAGFTLGDQVALNALDEFAAVPEPSSLVPLGIGLAGLAVLHPLRNRRRRR